MPLSAPAVHAAAVGLSLRAQSQLAQMTTLTLTQESHMTQITNASRRTFLKRATFSVALIPVAGLPLGAALAADLPPVTSDDPTAKALQYVPDASQAKGAKPGSKCANCVNYQGGAGSEQGGCVLFPGKTVKAAGWCSSWTAKK